MQELLALSELMAQMVRALTQGVCRADFLQVNLTIPLSFHSIIMYQAMNPQYQAEWCSISYRNDLVFRRHKFDS